MLRRRSLLLLLCCGLAGGVVVDRIAVIVNKRVIKTSDIERDLRVTQFLNRESLNLSADTKRKAAERLIDQSIIRDEIVKGAYTAAGPSDVDAMVKRIAQERFGGAAARLKQDLGRYGLTDEQLRLELQWQLDVLKFLDQRFRPGVLVTDDEVRSYYNQHQTDLRRQFPLIKTYEGMAPKVRESLEGERLNQNFEQWLASARKRNRIEYRQGAFE
jgi:hypothetical protein